MSTISEVKQRLATVREDSWHFRLANWIWNGRVRRTHKACFYWWVRVPVSLVAGGLLVTVGLPFAAMCAVVIILVVGLLNALCWFCGFTMSFVTSINPERDRPPYMCYPYKYSPRRDRQHRYAPYQLVLPPLGLIGLALLGWTINGHATGSLQVIEWTGLVFGAFAILMFIGLAAKAVGGRHRLTLGPSLPYRNFRPAAETTARRRGRLSPLPLVCLKRTRGIFILVGVSLVYYSLSRALRSSVVDAVILRSHCSEV